MSRAPVLLDERPTRLLVVAARPGDGDDGLAGSVARWVGEGSTAHLVCCTSGDAAGDDPTADPLALAAQGEQRQRAAAVRIGYEGVTFMHRPEGALANDLALREQLVRLIRTFRPDAIAAPDPRDILRADGTVVHADVRATGEAAIDAVEPAARQAMAFPHLAIAEGLAPHAVARLFLYGTERPTAVVDIGPTLATKVAALHEQRGRSLDAGLLETRIRADAANAGAAHGLVAAEALGVIDLRP
jgi:LmbE family N-acetylglucosaminyl deacetylase